MNTNPELRTLNVELSDLERRHATELEKLRGMRKPRYKDQLAERMRLKRLGKPTGKAFPQHAGRKVVKLESNGLLETMGLAPINTEENITKWEQLTEMYVYGIGMCTTVLSTVQQLPKENFAAVRDQKSLILHLRQMTIDAREFRAELDAIESLHRNRTGPIDGDDDHVLGFEINIKYISVIQRGITLLTDSFMVLIGLLNDVEEQAAQAPAEPVAPESATEEVAETTAAVVEETTTALETKDEQHAI